MIGKLTPKDAIRAYCTQCLGLNQFNTDQVKDCQGDQAFNGPCAFHPYRLGKRPSVKVFRAFCLDCMCGSSDSVMECSVENCECHPYRRGKNPALFGKRKAPEAGIAALKKFRDSSRDDLKSHARQSERGRRDKEDA